MAYIEIWNTRINLTYSLKIWRHDRRHNVDDLGLYLFTDIFFLWVIYDVICHLRMRSVTFWSFRSNLKIELESCPDLCNGRSSLIFHQNIARANIARILIFLWFYDKFTIYWSKLKNLVIVFRSVMPCFIKILVMSSRLAMRPCF